MLQKSTDEGENISQAVLKKNYKMKKEAKKLLYNQGTKNKLHHIALINIGSWHPLYLIMSAKTRHKRTQKSLTLFRNF